MAPACFELLVSDFFKLTAQHVYVTYTISYEDFFSADQVYGDEEMHGTVRKLCMDYMVGFLFCFH
jgi:hypothetical protein